VEEYWMERTQACFLEVGGKTSESIKKSKPGIVGGEDRDRKIGHSLGSGQNQPTSLNAINIKKIKGQGEEKKG